MVVFMFIKEIDAIIIQPTNECHLNSIYYKKPIETEYFGLKIFEKLLSQNSQLETPIKIIELGWSGEPLLHPEFKKIVEMLSQKNINHNIVTHGDLIKEKLAMLDDSVTKNTHFTIFLDGSNEETIKKISGKDILKQVIESP